MKNALIVSAMLASSFASAAVDYSHCQQALMMEGLHIDHEGKISVPFGFQANPDVSEATAGLNGQSSQTYTYKSQMLDLKGKPIEKKIQVTKDKDGNIVFVNTAQSKLEPQTLQMHKQMALQGAVHSGLTFDSLTYDPFVQVGGSTPGQQFAQGNYVQLSKLSKEQAKQFGVDIDELRKLRREVKKDKKTLKKIADGYERLLDKSHMMIPNGSEMAFEVKDGVCKVNGVTKVLHDTKAKVNHAGQSLNAERCEKVNKISSKYKKELESCSQSNMKMNQELYSEGGMVGGINGGGMAGGYIGGAAGGYNPYMGGGYGYGMGGYGMMGGSEVWDCQAYFGEGFGGGMAGGYVGGMGSGSSSSNKKSSTGQGKAVKQ